MRETHDVQRTTSPILRKRKTSKKHTCQSKTLKVKDLLHHETAGVVFSLSTAFNLIVSEIEIGVSKVEIAVSETKQS